MMASGKDKSGDHIVKVIGQTEDSRYPEGQRPILKGEARVNWEDRGKASWNIEICCNGHYKVTSASTLDGKSYGALFTGHPTKNSYGNHQAWVNPDVNWDDKGGISPWVFTKM